MTPEQIEQKLKHLGDATAPKDSLVSRVMERVNALDDRHDIVTANRVPRTRFLLRSAAMLTAMAACIAVVVSIHSIVTPPTPPVVIRPGNPTHPAQSETDSVLRLADYRRASTKSADAFEAMLREPPVHSPGVEPEIRAGDLSRAELNLN